MLRAGMLETKRAKLMVAVAVTLLLAAFQVAVQAKPAHAYEVRISITGAGQVTETTPANLVGSSCVTSASNPTGIVGINCFPGDPDGPYSWDWDVHFLATPKPGYRFVQWQSDGSSMNPVICDRSSPPATTSTYTGTACKFKTYENLQTRAVFVDDTSPQMNSLMGPNQVVNGAATFFFSATSDPTFRRFECRVAGVHDWQTCSSGHTENPPTGTYTLQVRAVDWSNNLSAESTWTWTVDKVTPETSITRSPDERWASTDATFEFTSNEAGTFICTLDGVTASCGSPKSYTGLSQGQHTFSVVARDVAGNVDPTPATRTFTVDTVAPETTLLNTGPSGPTSSTTAAFEFTSEPGASFKCQLDTGPIEPSCLSPRTYTSLGQGSHTFTVWARDALGNEDQTPATRTWTVDTVPPNAPTLGSPSNNSFNNTGTVTISGTAEPNSSVEIFDGATSKDTTTSNGSGDWSKTLSGVSEGPHTYTAKATDAAGNISEASNARKVIVDLSRPTIETWAPKGNNVSPRAKPTVTFSEKMNEVSVEKSVNGKPTTFVLKKGTTVIPATVVYTEKGSTFKAVLTPTKPLKAGAKYTASVTTGAKDLAGNTLVAKSWRFTVRR